MLSWIAIILGLTIIIVHHCLKDEKLAEKAAMSATVMGFWSFMVCGIWDSLIDSILLNTAVLITIIVYSIWAFLIILTHRAAKQHYGEDSE